MKGFVLIGWVTLIGAMVANVIGQFDASQFNVVSDPISTYAAFAPLGIFITASMLLSAFAFLIVGILVSKYRILGSSIIAHIVPALCGASAAGLIMLASFKETVRTWAALKHAGFWAVRIQSFHEAGLMIFFFSTLLLVVFTGVFVIVRYYGAFNRLLGSAIFGMAPASFLLMSTHWPDHIGFTGRSWGLRQRAALFCLWLAAIMLLTLLSRKHNAGRLRGVETSR